MTRERTLQAIGKLAKTAASVTGYMPDYGYSKGYVDTNRDIVDYTKDYLVPNAATGAANSLGNAAIGYVNGITGLAGLGLQFGGGGTGFAWNALRGKNPLQGFHDGFRQGFGLSEDINDKGPNQLKQFIRSNLRTLNLNYARRNGIDPANMDPYDRLAMKGLDLAASAGECAGGFKGFMAPFKLLRPMSGFGAFGRSVGTLPSAGGAVPATSLKGLLGTIRAQWKPALKSALRPMNLVNTALTGLMLGNTAVSTDASDKVRADYEPLRPKPKTAPNQ